VNPNGTVTELIAGVTPGFTGGDVGSITSGADGNLWFTEPFALVAWGGSTRI
jgi:hypothetical protein